MSASAHDLFARRNAVDPVNSANGLRKSESLQCAHRRLETLALGFSDIERYADMVHAADKPAFTELLKVAARALESAGYIIDAEVSRIEREAAK